MGGIIRGDVANTSEVLTPDLENPKPKTVVALTTADDTSLASDDNQDDTPPADSQG